VWRDKSVLVVEDDVGIREMLSEALGRELGAYTVVASDGMEALAWIARVRPTVAVLDVALPRLDGVEVARRVKADPATSGTWLIAISALSPMARVRQRALEAGCGDFLAKPFDLGVLLNLVHRRLAEADSRGGPGGPTPMTEWPNSPN
jgi:CheY-like chemotaxis protein